MFPAELKTSCLFGQRKVKHEVIQNLLIRHDVIYTSIAKGTHILSKDIMMYIKGQELNSSFLAKKSGREQFKNQFLTSNCATSSGNLATMDLGEYSTWKTANTD